MGGSDDGNEDGDDERPLPERTVERKALRFVRGITYKRGPLIGVGGFGRVYTILLRETGAVLAMKEISEDLTPERGQRRRETVRA